MKLKKDTISQKITLLNKTILNSMTERDSSAIVKNFAETGIKILEADFGFAWWKFDGTNEYKLAYKSPGTPYQPFLPRKKANHYRAIKTKKPIFDSNVKAENYGQSDISPYMRSFVIIPIYHDNHAYGSLTLCYKKAHNFTEEELTLSQIIGNSTAQAITGHRSVKTGVLLAQEKLKNEFIANATHELRTPLAIMKGNADLALMDKKNLKSAHEALKVISEEINNLSLILKDLALLTSAGQDIKYIVNPVPINIFNLLKDIARRLKTLALKKNINIKFENLDTEDIYISGEEKYLEKLFMNLFKNAITYGKVGGSVTINIAKEKHMAKIKVIDSGIGIPKEDLPRIFERFFRGEKAQTHVSHGSHSGLGLAIAKWVAEIHGGSIKAQSIHGKGSTFTVSLPLSVQP